MSYQVLARKWRPSTFAAMVGQDHVLQALVNALDSDRLHHAYLFTGTRGVGKTSIARLFAKSLNCEQGVSSKPCGQCSPCREISEGRFVDLIEVDAASRTKVEDTRELMENVQYAPTQGRYKVYLIDEVHMLSTHSFNALLKTLEEPPPHIKFLLATTDPQKLPVTILSRCLQFNLKNMVPEKIVEHLQQVLQAEQVPYDDNALWLLARGANGSMRDAMSLTDQGIAFGSGALREAEVRAMLGTVDQRQVLGMLQQLARGDAAAVLESVRQICELGADSDAILAELLGLLHRVGIAQMLPEGVDNSQGDREQIQNLAGQLRAEDVQLFYQIGVNGRRDLPHVPVAREGLEMTLLRMLAFRPVGAGELALPQQGGGDQANVPQQGAALASSAAIAESAGQAPVSSAAPSANTPINTAPVTNAPVTSAAVTNASNASVAISKPISEPEPPVAAAQAVADAPSSVQSESVSSAPPAYDDPPPWGDTPAGPEGDAKKFEAPAAAEPEPNPPAAAAMAEERSISPVTASELGSAVQPRVPEPEFAPVSEPAALSSEDLPAAVVEAGLPESAQPGGASTQAGTAQPVTPAEAPAKDAETSADSEAVTRCYDDVQGGELAQRWAALIDQIGLSGMTYNIAANAGLVSIEQGCWRFCLGADRIHLFNDTHQQRLAQALSAHLGETQRVDVVEGQADGETPAQYRDRKKRERQAEAVASIENDPNVRALIAEFDARIDPNSIQPIGNLH